MDNPLAQFFEVEERDDGIYIKVVRSPKGSQKLDIIENKLKEAKVTNYNLSTIADIVMRCRGVFEKVGPLFEYYDDKYDTFFAIHATSQKATIRIRSDSIDKSIKLTENLLIYALQRKNIKFGIKKNILRDMVVNNLIDVEVVVAEGLAAEPGIDAVIAHEINLAPDMTPAVDKSGRTDYRAIRAFQTIKKGQVLARRIPPKMGKPGTSIFGEPIPSTIGMDKVLPSGKNTETSPTNTELLALREGIVYIQDGLICVGELLHVNGNVDFSVGNIKYSGDVVIKGQVKPGFTIEAEGNIEIFGEVESARIISRKGYITIHRGLLGKNDSLLYAEKGIYLHFAQEATIKTDGILSIEKHMLHCQMICARVEGNRGHSCIIGGKLTLYESGEIGNLGNDSMIKTEIAFVDRQKQKAEEKRKELVDVREQLSKQLEPISKELKTKTSIMKKSGTEITERHKQELKKWIDSYNNLSLKVKYVDEKIAEIQKEIDSASYSAGSLKVYGTIFENVKIDMYGIANMEMRASKSNATIRLNNGNIQFEG
ncbi:DUF342 domain-containing protein [bacterium]|nr:DUF342 domain-containing protein [candidate division CSSED10-310 bacterium]